MNDQIQNMENFSIQTYKTITLHASLNNIFFYFYFPTYKHKKKDCILKRGYSGTYQGRNDAEHYRKTLFYSILFFIHT